jgi:hypothetical protein
MIKVEDIPRRIVLSRKGFDKSAGGFASPVLNDEMVSLPIPEHNEAWRENPDRGCLEKHLTYQDLASRKGGKVADLVVQLTKRKIRLTDCVHLDPDVRVSLREAAHSFLPLTFGQDGGSQTELRMLTEGDLFLFFGWFRKAEEPYPNVFRYARDGADLHAIWGWLQIAEILDLPSKFSRAKKIAPHHPHPSYPAEKTPNCLYVGRDSLSFIPKFAGAGAFPKFHRGLCLSDEQTHLRPRERLRSCWKLPAFFRNVRVTHLPGLHDPSKWEPSGQSIIGRGGASRGQEFVFETKGHEKDVAKWLESIFSGDQRQP